MHHKNSSREFQTVGNLLMFQERVIKELRSRGGYSTKGFWCHHREFNNKISKLHQIFNWSGSSYREAVRMICVVKNISRKSNKNSVDWSREYGVCGWLSSSISSIFSLPTIFMWNWVDRLLIHHQSARFLPVPSDQKFPWLIKSLKDQILHTKIQFYCQHFTASSIIISRAS